MKVRVTSEYSMKTMDVSDVVDQVGPEKAIDVAVMRVMGMEGRLFEWVMQFEGHPRGVTAEVIDDAH